MDAAFRALPRKVKSMQTSGLMPDLEYHYRKRLLTDPADVPARLALARSLFLRALQFTSKSEINPPYTSLESPERHMLKESLLQAAVAAQFSTKAVEQEESAEIARLACEMGAGDFAAEAQKEAEAMQNQLLAALLAIR